MALTLDEAKKMIEAAKAKAKAKGIPMSIAIVNAEGNLIAFEKMDNAIPASVNISQDKAYTAAAVRMGTHELGGAAQPGAPAFGIGLADKGRIMIFAGGLPVTRGQEVVGGIGCSGGYPSDDQEVAQAGLEGFK